MGHSSNGWAVLVILSLISPFPTKAISCKQAVEHLMPCQPFLLGVGEISSPCCLGAQALAQAMTLDRRSICQCLKHVSLSVNVNQDKANQLPRLCKLDVPVPIPPDVNCDAIPSGDVVSRVNRYTNLEVKGYRPTTPGNSPGIGHHKAQSTQKVKASRPTTPGNSPGIGHSKFPSAPKGS